MTKLFLVVGMTLAFALAPAVSAQEKQEEEEHEFAPLQEKSINYKDWTLKGLRDGQPVNLRALCEGKRLVLVVYFAPWCHNWQYEAPVAARLHERYRAQGLEVVAVSEYAPVKEVRSFFGDNGAPYPVVTESQAKDEREKTLHYTYRRAAGDTRKWGSPFNVFLEPAKMAKSGDVLSEKVWVVSGELVETEVERFVRERLGLEQETRDHLSIKPKNKTAKAISPCKQ